MKSASTLIPILEKAVLVQWNINKAINTVNEHEKNELYHKAIHNYSQTEWHKQRIAINKAIIARLTAYYIRLIERATIKQETPIAHITTNDNTPEVHSMNIL